MVIAYPRPYEIASGVPLLVLSCSSLKRDAAPSELVRFHDLYCGPMWLQVRKSAFPLSNVAAISALYGYLAPGTAIRTYDAIMDEKRARRMCSQGDDFWRLSRAIEKAGSAFVVGGALYQALAQQAIRCEHKLASMITFAAGSYLQQRKQLGVWLRQQERG